MSVLPVLLAAALGLLFGSFLNVAIHRGPALWGLAGEDRRARGTLIGPRSKCPSCGAAIAVLDLVPLASYFSLKGRCRACAAPIPLRYPVVEALGAAAFVLALALFGLTLQALIAAFFFLALIALAAIDFETGYLPEAITLPLIGAGLLANLFDLYTDGLWALTGAAVGYATFFVISTAYRRLRGREGLGLGDAALFAALGAWGGWPILAPAALFGALIALAGISLSAALKKQPIDATAPVPFGPALCAGGAAALVASQVGLPGF
jgi:leader peptidase (prepilin peptidase)/N-methyltransferase